MTNEKPLTKSELVATLREIGVATKDDVRTIIGEELTTRGVATKKDVDNAVHNQLTEFYAGYIKPEFEKVNSRLEKLEAGQERLETGQTHLQDELNSLKVDLATTPSRAEFEELKTQAARMRPTN